MISPKVLGAGLSRTGTRSLAEALRILGYKTAHCTTDGGKRLRPADMINYAAGADITIAGQIEECDRRWPDSQIVYTVRTNVDGWLESIERHFYEREPWHLAKCRVAGDPLCDVFVAAYGDVPPGKFISDWWRDAYLGHDERLAKFCNAHRKDICILDVSHPGGWEKLCGYLGRDVPAIPFPYVTELPDGELARHEISTLRTLARGRGVCVDLGTALGQSAAALSSVSGRVLTVDLFEDVTSCAAESDPGEGYLPVAQADAARNLARYKNCEVVRGFTAEAAGRFADWAVDLVFVDADHSAAGIRADYNAWWPKLKQAGVMAFHDTNNAHPAVRDFVQDTLAADPNKHIEVDLGPQAGTIRAFRRKR